MCKVRYSSDIMMDDSVEKLFKEDPRYEIVHKIVNSMWRWGAGRRVWNEVVDAYDAIRRFTVPIEGMEVRLDYTTSYNERGRARHSNTFLDGVFAFLLYYRGEHVMTLGFSIMKGRKLLIQQVQLRKRKGNRWLFKLPQHRMEFFLKLFRESFPDHHFYIADGGEVVGTSLNSYRRGLVEARERSARAEQKLARAVNDEDREWHERDLIRSVERQKELTTSIAHLEEDLPRLKAFYRDVGCFNLGASLEVNEVTHYELELT